MPKGDNKLSALSIEELIALREEVDQRIAEIAASEMNELKQRMAKLEPYVPGRKPVADKRKGPVAAKYKDPQSGQTWSGRGRTPKWLTAYEAKGKDRSAFEV